jgi:glyoxylase-like metal-dependent hydrolase (beta-lactamase superfamily II)
MIEEILKGIYKIEIPLPRNPLRSLNSYLIKGMGKNLLVDTGFNWVECKEAQLNAMAALGVDWSEVDFFITHVHGDHSGLVHALASKNSRVYCSRTDADIMRASMTSAYWQEVNAFFILHGYPQQKITNQEDTIKNFISGSDLDFTYVKDGDVLEIGAYHLVCTATPGHSPGHMCLYEPEHKFLIAGDHILASITSNITAWGGIDDFLERYLVSLEKVDAMDISLVLPGHRQLIYDYHGRIAELKQHHQNRLEEIRNILRAEAMNAYQVASHMHWNLTYNSWEDFPSFQKWFATGETIAHLEHLVQRNEVLRIHKEQRLVYSIL